MRYEPHFHRAPHNYPIFLMPIVPTVGTADGEAEIVNVTDCLLKCLVYRGVGRRVDLLRLITTFNPGME